MLVVVDVGLSLVLTAIVGVVAVSVAVVPIVLMMRAEHRELHGEPRSWRRAHGGRPDSILDAPRQYNETTQERQQELV